MKTIIKVALAALVVNASWQAGSTYWRYYRFKDEVQQSVLFSSNSKTESDLQNTVLSIASELQVPLAPQDVSVRRGENHIRVDATYSERIQLVPTYYFPYQFNLNLDVLAVGAGSIAPIR